MPVFGELHLSIHVTVNIRSLWCRHRVGATTGETPMNQIIYIVGLVVIVIAILSFFGLR